MAGFDPYHKWLAIPSEEQPPHHYRLLGTAPFEDDPDVIDTAAEQRMAYLRSCATGEYVVLSQRLLNEVVAARLCLLDPGRKAAYDAELKAALDPPEPVAWEETIGGVPATGAERKLGRNPWVGIDAVEEIDENGAADRPLPAVARPKRRPLGRREPLVEPPPIGVLVVGGIAVLGVVLLVGGLLAYRMFGGKSDGTEVAGSTVIDIDARNRREALPPRRTGPTGTAPKGIAPPGTTPVGPTSTAPHPPAPHPLPSNPLPTSPAANPVVATGPQWIWHGTTRRDCVLRKEFPGGSNFALLLATADDAMTVFVDGRRVAENRQWSSPIPMDVQPHLAPDRAVHVLQVVCRNADKDAGFVARLVLGLPDGRRQEIVSDGTWESAESENTAAWSRATVLAPLGGGPWNEDPVNRPLGAKVVRHLNAKVVVQDAPADADGPGAAVRKPDEERALAWKRPSRAQTAAGAEPTARSVLLRRAQEVVRAVNRGTASRRVVFDSSIARSLHPQ